MTNRQRLEALSDSDYALELSMINNCTAGKYMDFERWLNSDDQEYPIKGRDALYQDVSGQVPCVVVDEHFLPVGKSVPFKKIVVRRGFHDFEILSVSFDKVI